MEMSQLKRLYTVWKGNNVRNSPSLSVIAKLIHVIHGYSEELGLVPNIWVFKSFLYRRVQQFLHYISFITNSFCNQQYERYEDGTD